MHRPGMTLDKSTSLCRVAGGKLRERTDDQLSGEQTISAAVALRLAMPQTIGAHIAFFDEPTSNLDATRRENHAHAFRAIDVGKEEVTEHCYDQLFLISHDVEFTEVMSRGLAWVLMTFDGPSPTIADLDLVLPLPGSI